ncbi:hypothetical protein M885DRAFT_625787 [Pelagophyceae sp. CCMP2097]|nr:hypothetical protein M885DRAFT_625787 [Pelagophyceae sp. CCMP2097]
MDEREFDDLVCDFMGAGPKPRIAIEARDYRTILNKKSRLPLIADPVAVDASYEKWTMKLPSASDEIRCPNCGAAHRNAPLVECYRTCHHCAFPLKAPASIHVPESFRCERAVLRVLAATYGHLRDARRAVDVTAALQDWTRKAHFKRLYISRDDDLLRVLRLRDDPTPQRQKALRVRYVMDGRRGELTLPDDFPARPFRLREALNVVSSKQRPLITLLRAWYGHPKGVVQGRGAFDVADVLQARIDGTGGRCCAVGRGEDLTQLFGEPAAGRAKCLVVEYEIAGKAGELSEYESRGRLERALVVDADARVAPQLVVLAATYGWTEELARERTHAAQKAVFDLNGLKARRQLGLALTPDEDRRLRALPETVAELRELQGVAVGFVDVRDRVQRQVELCSGRCLFFAGAEPTEELPPWAVAALGGLEADGIRLDAVDDLNAMFGNPNPRQLLKLLDVSYLVVGHDAERRTEAHEATSSGYEANFILQRRGRITRFVRDDADGAALLDRSILVGVPTALPGVEVRYACYGNEAEPSQTYDVTAECRAIANRLGGQRLFISKDVDLAKLFGDPCEGIRKKLSIKYYARGFHGCCRVEESPLNYLSTDVCLGFADSASDPFQAAERKSVRQAATERIARVKIRPGLKGGKTGCTPDNPYSHLGNGF